MNSSRQLQHLYWRAGFSPRKALRQLLHDSEKYEPLVGPGLSYADPQGMVMTTPNQPALAGTPAATVPYRACAAPNSRPSSTRCRTKACGRPSAT